MKVPKTAGIVVLTEPQAVQPTAVNNRFSVRQKRVSTMLLASFASSIACQLPQYAFLLAGLAPRYTFGTLPLILDLPTFHGNSSE
ncbi:hypothetical protein BV898_02088 [Hypsibius exemplaris]|uniref:Uncharacterized protein n=1 Tax=Hypsibius exemplaris TaxID=2072580 RepID=A0A1W0X9C8_HYPEX|nr:hypothetical protein BV898_02088 [Hypsibius exemplaris]